MIVFVSKATKWSVAYLCMATVAVFDDVAVNTIGMTSTKQIHFGAI
jgi:hypothetical protein